MITALITFLSSNAGGAMVGLLIEWMDARRKDREQVASAQLERDLAYHDQLQHHNAALDKASAASLHPKHFRLKIWGFEIERETQTAHYAPRTWVVSIALLMLAFTFCAVLIVFAGNPWAEIITLNPTESPTRIGIPWLFMAEFSRERVFVLNAGGVVYGMLIGLNFILSTAIVGGVRRAFR